MTWIADNWSLVVVLIIIVGGVAVAVKKFFDKTYDEQVASMKKWLLWAVIQAERLYGEKTGPMKLRDVYQEFCGAFPWIARFLTFDKFSGYVDEALVNMKALLESNVKVREYVGELS